MTITQAIRKATALTRMEPFGGQYMVEAYSERFRAWMQSTPTDYHTAKSALTERRHASALVALGWDEHDAHCEACYKEGSLRERVKASIGG